MNKPVLIVLAIAGFAWTTAFAVTISPTGNATNDTEQIQNAVNSGGTVTLNAGTYGIIRAITISNGASIVGGGSAPGDVILSLATQTVADGNQNIIKIENSDSTVVSNLTVTARDVKSDRNQCGPNSGISMDSGLVVDCLIANIKTKNGGIHGGGVNMSGGTVRGCTFTKCEAYNSSGNQGAGEAVYMTGGLVENCVMVSNNISHACNPDSWNSYKYGGTVCMSGGTLRGCLIVDNVGHRNGLGVAVTGGTVESCTIARNRQFNADSDAYAVGIGGNNVVFRNNIVWGNTAFDGSVANVRIGNVSTYTFEYNDTKPLLSVGSGNIAVEPEFVDAANGDYHVGYSYCSDAGYNQDWMAGAVDLDGNVRIRNNVVDMGCYESVPPVGFACRMSLTSDELPDLATVALECECTGGDADSAEWTFTRQEDQSHVDASGCSTTIQLGPGTWDVNLVVCRGQQSAQRNKIGAVIVQSTKVYANAKGAGVFPYDAPEKGLPSINDALQALGVGGTLYVAAGDYVISNRLNLVDGRGTRIVSMAGPENTIVRLADVATFKSDKYYGLYLDSSDAYVSGLTFVAGRAGKCYSGPEYYSYGFVKVLNDGAVLTNCVFRDLKFIGKVNSQLVHDSVGLELSKGTVVDCLFTRIDAYSSGGGSIHGCIIKVTGGLADRIRVEDCWMDAHSGYTPGGSGDVVGVYYGGVLRNSLVTRCSSNHGAPIYVGQLNGGVGGCMLNCTFVANTNIQEKTYHTNPQTEVVTYYNHTAGLQIDRGSVTNCIVANNWSVYGNAVSNIYNTAGADGIGYTLVDDRVGDTTFVTAENHNVAVLPNVDIFRGPEVGKYTLCANSPAIDAGLMLGWMDGARDLAGGPRVVSRIPDIGCYESTPKYFYIRLR